MSELRCVIRDKDGNQCPTVIQVFESVSEKVSYMCRLHPGSVMRKAAGNTTPARTGPNFQTIQFDPDMDRSGKPQGTSHIGNQGGADKIAQKFDRDGIPYPHPNA